MYFPGFVGGTSEERNPGGRNRTILTSGKTKPHTEEVEKIYGKNLVYDKLT